MKCAPSLTLALMLTTLAVSANETNSQQGNQAGAEPTSKIEIFCDFRCPFCARLFSTLFPLAKSEHRQLTFRFRHYPFHQGSEELARFFEAARLQSSPASPNLLENIYRFQHSVTPDNLAAGELALAVLHGLNTTILKRDLQARDVALAVSRDEQDAVAMKVDHTPSVFLNGVLLIGPPELIALAVLHASPLAPATTISSDDEDCNVCGK